ncbi:MAG: hypothetical protein F4052_08130 [Dehalococcoidia bacterium]|nr:hypothetical protein [Dehalococcoidia bacterium]
MKKNLISAIAGWKSAALLALVAMLATVAFSGVLTSTQTADAQATPASAPPGSTVIVSWPGQTGTTAAHFRISPDSAGSATFAANGATTIQCAEGNALCDANLDATTGTGVQLAVKIDEDSPLGQIFVQLATRSAGQYEVADANEHTITVIAANPPVSIKALNSPAAAITKDSTGDGAMIVVQIVNARGVGINGAPIQITTTRGGLSIADAVAYVAPVDDDPQTDTDETVAEVALRPANAVVTGTLCQTLTAGAPGSAACSLQATTAAGADTTTDRSDDVTGGIVAVVLKGNGGTGTAEVVFRHLASGLSHTATVILHGDAASISTSLDQGTIAVGGSTFIVVTVSDADGNPVVGNATVGVRSNNPRVPAVSGPEVPAGSSAIPVVFDPTVSRPNPPLPNTPACGTGTNTAGQCAIQVSAPGGDTPSPADDATRGTHTIIVGTTNVLIPTSTVEVQVGGAPASIEHDAPASVESLSSTKITVTVTDDEGVRVGAVPISVAQVEGSGKADEFRGGADAMTSDGRATFTFLAPLSAGEAVFLVRAGKPGQVIQETITIAIGDAPAAESDTWNNDLVSGQNLVVWNGEDGADPSDGAADGVTAIWSYNTGSGSWDGYFPSAADVPGGNTLTSLSNGQAYVVIVE